MPRSRRFWSLAIMAAVVVAPVVGCDSAAGGGSAGGTVTLTVWDDLNGPLTGAPGPNYWFNAAIRDFERANPHIKVDIVNTANGSTTAFNTLLKSSEVSGNTPDVAELFAGGQVLQNGSFLVPLNHLIPSSYVQSLQGWQFTTAGYRNGGQIYGVPYGGGYWYFVYYNKALFAKAGVQPLGEGATWNDLLTLAAKIKRAGITPFTFGVKTDNFGAWTEDALISGQVGTSGVIQMYNGARSLDSAPILRAYAAWRQLQAGGLANAGALSLSFTQAIADFSAGQGAMTITGGFFNQQIQQGLKSNVGIFPVPALAGSPYPRALSGGPNNAYVIFKSSKHPADAARLVEYLTSIKVQEQALADLGQLPNNTSYTLPAAVAEQEPLMYDTYQYIQRDHYNLFEAFDNVMPASVYNYWYQTNTAVFSGAQSPGSAASALESQMKQYLATQRQSSG
jgi:raffinose/stachyose/melibiose transport system substrate-binding protein